MGAGLKRAIASAKATWDASGPSCATCEHFDGEHWCALLMKDKLVVGYITNPALVVCAKHEAKDP